MKITMQSLHWLKLSPISLVLIISILLGALQSVHEGINVSDAIENGQVLSGLVHYASDDPIGMYYYKAYSLADHFSGVWLKAGLSVTSLAFCLQLLKGALLFSGIALCTYALTNQVIWSVLAPIVWYSFGLWQFTEAYPITLISHSNTNGFLGLAWAGVTLGLIGNRKAHYGGFALGIFPYVHLSFGAFAWLLAGIWVIFSRPKFKQLLGFIFGALVFISTYWGHTQIFVHSTQLAPGLIEYYFRFFTLNFDYHRQPLQVHSVHTFVLLVILICSILLLNLQHRTSTKLSFASLIPITAIAAIVIAYSFSIIGYMAGLNYIPDTILQLMPGRLANIALLLSIPILFGLASYLPRSSSTTLSILISGSYFVPLVVASVGLSAYGWDDPVSVIIWFLSLSVVLLSANYPQPYGAGQILEQIHWNKRFARWLVVALLIWAGFRLLHTAAPTMWFPKTFELKQKHFIGLLVLLASFYSVDFLVKRLQFDTAKTKLIPNQVGWRKISQIYFPLMIVIGLGGLLMEKISILQYPSQRFIGNPNIPRGAVIPLANNVGMQFNSGLPVLWAWDTRTIIPYIPEAGPGIERYLDDVYGWYKLYDPSGWKINSIARWEQFTNIDWQRIASLYRARSVAASCDIHLTIPLVARTDNDCFYKLPDIDYAIHKAYAALDNTSPRFFFFPKSRRTLHGWEGLNVDSAKYTHTWNTLNHSGQLGVYVNQTGNYNLKANISTYGSLRLSARPHGVNAQPASFDAPANDCAIANVIFPAIPLHAGFNVVDVKAEGEKQSSGTKSSDYENAVIFRDIQWEPASVLNGHDHVIGQCIFPTELVGGQHISAQEIEGIWRYQGRITKVINKNNKIVCVNERGDQAQATIVYEKFLLVRDWRIYASLSKDGKSLEWSNDSTWRRP